MKIRMSEQQSAKIADLSPYLRARVQIEFRIAAQVVRDAITAGCSIDIDDGDSPTISDSTDHRAILDTMFGTDEERLSIRKDGKIAGWVYFVYGNDGWDVISDYSSNDLTRSILESALTLSGKIKADVESYDMIGAAMSEVYVLAISHKHGTNISAHRTLEGAEGALDAYVVQEWGSVFYPDVEMPEDQAERWARYFDHAHDETYSIDECELEA